MYKWTYLENRKSHRYRKQTYFYQEGSGGGINWEVGRHTHTTIYKTDN